MTTWIGIIALGTVCWAANPPYIPSTPITKESHGFSLLDLPLKYPENFKHLSYVNPEAPKGGTLKLHVTGTFDNLNPYILKGNKGASTTLPFDTLMTGTYDETDTYYGLIAKKVELPLDRSFITFFLREEARWHDATPILAEDVAFSYELLKQKGTPSYRSVLNEISKVDILDKRKIRFTFKDTLNRDALAIPALMPILSKAYFTKNAFDKTTLTPPLGSGPYRIREVKPGHTLIFERIKDYWGRDLPINKGHYNFDEIQIDYYRDDGVALEAFKAGQVDARQEFSSKLWMSEYTTPAVKKGDIILESIRHQKPVGFQGLFFNVRRDKFKDRRVRKALSLAFDFEWLNKNLFYGRYQRSLSLFENSSMAGTKTLPTPAEQKRLEPFAKQLAPEVFTHPFSLPPHDTREHIRSILNEAGQLLADAGWKMKKGKRVNAKNEPFTFEILLANAALERSVQFYIQNLQKLGLNASIRTLDPAQYQNRRQSFDYDVLSIRFGGSLIPGIEQVYRWGSVSALQPGSPNISGVQNKTLDLLLEQLVAARTLNDITEIAHALDRVIMWEYYAVPAWHYPYHDIATWNKFGKPAIIPPYLDVIGSSAGEPIASLHLWWSLRRGTEAAIPAPTRNRMGA